MPSSYRVKYSKVNDNKERVFCCSFKTGGDLSDLIRDYLNSTSSIRIFLERVLIRGKLSRDPVIRVLRKYKSMAQPHFRIFQDRAGYYRWTLIAGNGEPVATSEGYNSHFGIRNSVLRVKAIASEATVVDEVQRSLALKALLHK